MFLEQFSICFANFKAVIFELSLYKYNAYIKAFSNSIIILSFKSYSTYMYVEFLYLNVCIIKKNILMGPLNTFFLEIALKKLPNIFLNYFFYLKVQSLRLIKENDFIQMAVSAGHAVAYAISPIFMYIIDCVQLYYSNDFTNFIL